MPDFVPYAVVLAVVVLVIIGIVHLYNNMVALRNRCDNAWQTIDTQLQRRSDLIPNLVETVKGYASHESKTLEAVIAARQNYVSASTPEQVMDAANQTLVPCASFLRLRNRTPILRPTPISSSCKQTCPIRKIRSRTLARATTTAF